MTDRSDQASDNASFMPECARFIVEFREVFGPVRVTFAQENGRELGRRGDEGVMVSTNHKETK